MKNLIFCLTLCLLSSLFTGCATIMSGSSQDLSFNSSPDGAEVTVGGRVIGKTPITTRLSKQPGQTITFTKDGYKPLSMKLETRMNGWFWGNIILGGFLGSTTDGITGSVNEYSPSQYMATLTPLDAERLEEKTNLSDNQKIKEFVVVSYREIIKDLQTGDGPYLSSLLSMLGTAPAQKSETVKKIKALSTIYTNIPEFAERVNDLVNTQTPAPQSAPSTTPSVPKQKPTQPGQSAPATPKGTQQKGSTADGLM